MVYLIGFLGFAGGFAFGQVLLMLWLKDRTRKELLTDRDLRFRYGLFNWGLAALCCYLAVKTYQLNLVLPG